MHTFMIALLECSFSMTVIGMLYMALMPVLQRRFTASGRYYAWLVIAVGLIIPFRFHFSSPLFTIDAWIPMLQQSQDSMNALPPASSVEAIALFPWHILLFAIWGMGLSLFVIYHIHQHRRFLGMVRRWGAAYSDEQGLLLLQEMKESMRITRPVRLQVCPGILSPMLIGLFRPVILLPSADISRHELQFFLKHELVHLKRGDILAKILIFMATALHWFNPFVYRMAREIELQCELSCDEEVIRYSDIQYRQQYVEAIIGSMKRQAGQRAILLSTSFSNNKLNLQRRVRSIMDTRVKKWGPSLLAIILSAILIIGAVIQLNPAKPDESEASLGESVQPVMGTGNSSDQTEKGESSDEASMDSESADKELSGTPKEQPEMMVPVPQPSEGEAASQDNPILIQDQQSSLDFSVVPSASASPTVELRASMPSAKEADAMVLEESGVFILKAGTEPTN